MILRAIRLSVPCTLAGDILGSSVLHGRAESGEFVSASEVSGYPSAAPSTLRHSVFFFVFFFFLPWSAQWRSCSNDGKRSQRGPALSSVLVIDGHQIHFLLFFADAAFRSPASCRASLTPTPPGGTLFTFSVTPPVYGLDCSVPPGKREPRRDGVFSGKPSPSAVED